MSIDRENLKEKLENQCSENLRLIYEQQMELTRFHNGMVWQVSSIFIPFSLAGLALDFKTDEQLIFVGVGSIAIIVMWTAFAEWHRWIWVHSFCIAGIIENIWGVRGELPGKPGIKDYGPPRLLGMDMGACFDFGRILRLLFFLAGIVFWLRRINSGITEEGVLACLLN